MLFSEHLQESQMAKTITDMVDLPLFEAITAQVQSYMQDPSGMVKKDIERLLYKTSEDLKIWAEHMNQYGATSGQQAGIVKKILGNPQGAAQALIRKYVLDNVQAQAQAQAARSTASSAQMSYRDGQTA